MKQTLLVVCSVASLLSCDTSRTQTREIASRVLYFTSTAQLKAHVVSAINQSNAKRESLQGKLEKQGFILYQYRDSVDLLMQYTNPATAPNGHSGLIWLVRIEWSAIAKIGPDNILPANTKSVHVYDPTRKPSNNRAERTR
jgi:hypothetical protein